MTNGKGFWLQKITHTVIVGIQETCTNGNPCRSPDLFPIAEAAFIKFTSYITSFATEGFESFTPGKGIEDLSTNAFVSNINTVTISANKYEILNQPDRTAIGDGTCNSDGGENSNCSRFGNYAIEGD